MANYRVRAVGADFEASDDDGSDYISPQVAGQAAVRAAIAIAADEIERGKKSSIIEAHVRDGHRTISRFVIALSVEALPPLD